MNDERYTPCGKRCCPSRREGETVCTFGLGKTHCNAYRSLEGEKMGKI